jgi:serine/threonine protein kinase
MSDTSEPKRCPKCGAPIPAEAPQGLCPKCLLQQASAPTEAGRTESPKSPPPTREELTAAFPQLEILELIGQGGMGFVFKARQRKLERLVALKILPRSLAADPAFAERFTREGRVLARLNHPNIVTIHDFGQANGFFYLLMEFVDGVNLRQAMKVGRFTPEQALAVVPKICDALQFAHNEGILHRDIKPENILLDSKGRVKIADFGIAKLVGEPRADATRTASGALLGTPQYMAPEQLEKPSQVDHRADIFSLGVVFYEMLTGELPLGKFQPPSQKVRMDVRLDEVVLHALEKEPERRYQQVSEVKTAVETVSANPPQETRKGIGPRRNGIGFRKALAVGMKVGVVVFLLTALPATIITFLLPNAYTASARVKLEQVRPVGESWYPYLFQEEMARIRSSTVFDKVIEKLKLPERWGQRYGGGTKLTRAQAYQLLANAIDVQPVRNTSFLQITFSSERPAEAAEVANSIAENYRAYHAEQLQEFERNQKNRLPGAGDSGGLRQDPILVRVTIMDQAVSPLRPSRPNRPLNIALGIGGGIVLGVLAGLTMAMLVWAKSYLAPRESAALAAPRPERFWRRFALTVLALVVGVLAAAAILEYGRARKALYLARQAEQAAQEVASVQAEVDSAQLVISPEQFTVPNPEPGRLDWGFKCFAPPDHVASLVFVVWTNGTPIVDPAFSAYFKVGKAGGIDVPFCSVSCYAVPDLLAGMTEAQRPKAFAEWPYLPPSAGISNAVQWNVNLGLGYTVTSWHPMPPYHRDETQLPLKIRSGHQGVLPLVYFDPEHPGHPARSRVELRIFLEPLRSPPIRTLPDEIDRPNYIAGKGLTKTMEETLKVIRERRTDP